MLEKELKILEINPEKLIKKLEKFWAIKTFEWDIHDTYYDFDDTTLDKIKMSLRIRKKAWKFLYTIKKKIPHSSIKVSKEIEYPIKCIKTYKNRLDKHNLNINREKKKYRISYKIWETIFDIDFYKEFPPLVEIEAQNEEEIKKWIKKLKLEKNIQKKFWYRWLVKFYKKKNKEKK